MTSKTRVIRTITFGLFLSTLLTITLLSKTATATLLQNVPPAYGPAGQTPQPESDLTDIPSKPLLEDGEPVEIPGFVRPSQLDTLDGVEAPQDNLPQSGPIIDVWYGTDQHFGQNGEPVKWVNILGNVSPAASINRMDYKLNGGSYQRMDVGIGRRLWDPGEFNVEIPYSDLQSGDNSIVIRALDTGGNESFATVTVQYTPNQTWPLPYVADWGNATAIEDVAQVTDGLWQLEDEAVRTVQIAYDRTIAIGDREWTEFEVTVPVTIHQLDTDSDAWEEPSNGPGVGLLMRWQGAYSTGGQVAMGWNELGAIDWFRWRDYDGTIVAGLDRVDAGTEDANVNVVPQIGQTYLMKAQVKNSSSCGGNGYYRFKTWLVGNSEPNSWNHAGCETTADGAQPLSSGSFVLLSHHVDASFGQAIVTAPDLGRPTLSLGTSGNGQTSAAPNWPDYAYYQPVTLMATPQPGYIFDGWTGDIDSNDNPLSFNITSDTVLTANFVQPIYTLDVTLSGEGAVTKSPDKQFYASGEQVLLTAEPAPPQPGYIFDGWTGDIDSNDNPLSFNITSDTVLTANFVQPSYTLDVTVSGEGAVMKSPDKQSYASGEQILLTAEPAPGWRFESWGGVADGTNISTTVTMQGSASATAEFMPEYYELDSKVLDLDGNLIPDAATVVISDPLNLLGYVYGEQITATAIIEPEWAFVRWEGASDSDTNPTQFSVMNDDMIRAVLERNQYTLSTSIIGDGKVTGGNPGPYLHGETVILNAVAASGFRFSTWVGDIPVDQLEQNTVSLTMKTDKAVTAIFVATQEMYLPFVVK